MIARAEFITSILKVSTYYNVCYHCSNRGVLSHIQLIGVLWEPGCVVIGVLDENSDCSSGPEGSVIFIYGNHLHHGTSIRIILKEKWTDFVPFKSTNS